MKELSIEEKAKAYDIALKKIKMLLGTGSNCSREELEYVFLELRESEDERIMEKVIATIHLYYGEPLEDEAKEMIAWLEKQNSLMKCLQIANARIGELIEENYYLKEKQGEQKSVEDLTQQEAMDFAVAKCFEQGEQKPADKVEQKFKVGDVMRTIQEAKDGCTDGMPFVVSIDSEYYNCNSEKIAIKDQDKYEYPPMNRKHDFCDSCDEQKPAENKGMNLAEEDMTPFQKKVFCIVDTTIEEEQGLSNICNELLSLAIQEIEQNPTEWSEEDEKGLGDALWCCKQAASIAKDENDMGNVWYAEHWLKSLKERYAWKPSNEQINALAKNVEYVNVGCTQPILKGLLEQLKKLMKE